MTAIWRAATAWEMTEDWARPSDCRFAKTRRADTPHAPTSEIRWLHIPAGADMPMTFGAVAVVAAAVRGAGAASADSAGVVVMRAATAARPASAETRARFMDYSFGGSGDGGSSAAGESSRAARNEGMTQHWVSRDDTDRDPTGPTPSE